MRRALHAQGIDREAGEHRAFSHADHVRVTKSVRVGERDDLTAHRVFAVGEADEENARVGARQRIAHGRGDRAQGSRAELLERQDLGARGGGFGGGGERCGERRARGIDDDRERLPGNDTERAFDDAARGGGEIEIDRERRSRA